MTLPEHGAVDDQGMIATAVTEPIVVRVRTRHDVAIWIRCLRRSRGWSQFRMGQHLGISQQRVAVMEKSGNLRLKTLERVAGLAEQEVVMIFEGEPDRPVAKVRKGRARQGFTGR